MQNRIYKTELIEWQKVKDLQPENLKLPYNYENIKNSILKYGISKAYDVCEIDGELYWIDGHTRTQILYELVNDGVKVPNKLTANFCKVKNKKEAIEILLEVHNQRQNPIAEEVLVEWLEVEEIESIDVESLNVKIDENKEEKGLRNIIGNKYDTERNINNGNYVFIELSNLHINKLQDFKLKNDIENNQDAILKLIENI